MKNKKPCHSEGVQGPRNLTLTYARSLANARDDKVISLRVFSFTLIEVIVSLAVIGLIIPAIFSIVFVLMNQQAKIQRLKIIKQEGDYILNHISNQIKNNAIGVVDSLSAPEQDYYANPTFSCGNVSSDTGQDFFIIDKGKNTDYNNWFKYVLDSNKISSQSSATTDVVLNSLNVKISKISLPPLPFISCKKDANNYSPAIISVNFRIEYTTTSTRVEDQAFFNYQGSFKLRTY